jgi:hypothetical protein
MRRHPALPPEDLPLTEASVQEIQLELIRRHRFNMFDGPKIVTSLRDHRSLWTAVLMGQGSSSDLITLRDLPQNFWNADTLYILTHDYASAAAWERIAEEEQWHADDVQVIWGNACADRLGTSEPGYLVQFWWD